jgi:hypothetical protein
MNTPEFSVILPFYKQSDHMQAVVDEFIHTLKDAGESFEIIVVMNGIGDLPAEEALEESGADPKTIRIKLRGAGWGRAVKRGLKEGDSKYLCYTNSARTDPKELLRLMQYAKLSEDVIVKATRIEREDKTRKWVSVIYNLCNRLILRTPIWDVNATPKIIPKKILDRINVTSDGDSIDAEIMYKSFLLDIPSIEVPSNHIMRRSGKSTTKVMSAFKMFWGLIEIKINGRK